MATPALKSDSQPKCRICHKGPDETPFGIVKGQWRSSYCKLHRNMLSREHRAKLRYWNPRNKTLGRYNLSILSTLSQGFYELCYQTTGKPTNGFLLVGENSCYLRTKDEGYHIVMDMAQIAHFLANRGVTVTAKKVEDVCWTNGSKIAPDELLDDEHLTSIWDIQPRHIRL